MWSRLGSVLFIAYQILRHRQWPVQAPDRRSSQPASHPRSRIYGSGRNRGVIRIRTIGVWHTGQHTGGRAGGAGVPVHTRSRSCTRANRRLALPWRKP